MQRVIRVLGVCVILSLAMGADRKAWGQQSTQLPQPSVISASAQGEVRTVPDRALIVLSVQTRNSSAASAAADNAQRQQSVIAAMRSLGISESEISTQSYTINPETRNDSNRTPRVVSYFVSNEIKLDISNLSLVGKVIDSALSHGANQVSTVAFFRSDVDSLYQKALFSAVQKAKSEATLMASAAGGHLGRLIELSSDGGRPPTPMFSVARASSFATETPIMAGQTTVQASVSGKWAFIPDK